MAMSKQRIHDVLSKYVSDQIQSQKSSLTAVEWVQIMNAYSAHMPVKMCAERIGLSEAEVRKIYYQFTMEEANSAMEDTIIHS